MLSDDKAIIPNTFLHIHRDAIEDDTVKITNNLGIPFLDLLSQMTPTQDGWYLLSSTDLLSLIPTARIRHVTALNNSHYRVEVRRGNNLDVRKFYYDKNIMFDRDTALENAKEYIKSNT